VKWPFLACSYRSPTLEGFTGRPPIIATLTRMSDHPYDGRIVIDWRRVADAPPDDFDWRSTPERSGLMTDEEISRLLKEIAKRI
jgi:hypothetical protein